MGDPSTAPRFAHLGPFSDFVDAARKQGPLFPSTHLDRNEAREILRFTLNDDRMFTPKGMRDADSRIADLQAGASKAYRGEFYDAPHRFDLKMQEVAFAWLRAQLGNGRGAG
jgi:hypothetical protein